MNQELLERKDQKPVTRGKTVLRTFRIPEELDKVLKADAKEQGRTRTELLLSLVTRYVGFDRYAAKFGFITLNKRNFKAIIEAIPDEKLSEIAKSQASGLKEMIQFWFRKSDMESLLGAIDIFSKYLRGFEYTLSRSDKEVAVTMHSDLGMKCTYFASCYWQEAITLTVGINPELEVHNDSITIRIPITLQRGMQASRGEKGSE